MYQEDQSSYVDFGADFDLFSGVPRSLTYGFNDFDSEEPVPDLISSSSHSHYSPSLSPAPLSPTLNNSFLSLDIHSPTTTTFHAFTSYPSFDHLTYAKSHTQAPIHSTSKSTTLPSLNTASWDQLEWSAGGTDTSDNQSDMESMGKAEKYWLANQTPSVYQPQIQNYQGEQQYEPKSQQSKTLPEFFPLHHKQRSPIRKNRSKSFSPSESEFSEDDSVYSLPSCESLANFSPLTRSSKMISSKSTPNSLSSYNNYTSQNSNTLRKKVKYNFDEELEEDQNSDVPIKTPRRRNSTSNKPHRRRNSIQNSPPSEYPHQFKCNIIEKDGVTCQSGFKRTSDLTRHFDSIHGSSSSQANTIATVTKPKFNNAFGRGGGTDSPKKTSEWGCKGCGGFFSRKDALIRHRRIRGCE